MIGIALAMQVAAATGDTTGYWQQRVHYSIIAHLDEGLMGVTAQGRLRYVNNSPDTLREMFFHQYLNAFKQDSKWSAADARENRVRSQNLREPDYGYERFTRAPVIDGVPTLVDYPGSPDSTVAHLRLPRPLPPGDSVTIELAWEARPSTVARRQGRRGRTYDLAQWYPKVAVYDRGGWQANALVPAGELYGEFGTYDVTLVARDDQVLAATGIVVSGDPGWARVSRTGAPWMPRVPASLPETPVIRTPGNERAVRFFAEHVHHFAWSASPEYIYEGATYAKRDTARRRYPTYDTVAVNVLFKPGDDTTWGGGRAVKRTQDALAWLEGLYGPYAYPQITNVHRIDGGGTEFPMMIMDGSPSYGLILHELGHVYSYGILANNEWRSGWMDEGLTDYQTYWAQKLSPQDRVPREFPRIGSGYRANATTTTRQDSTDFESLRLEMTGRAEPPGTIAHEFREFGIYNRMIYDRARIMYGHLREMMGDSVFTVFLRDYYERWALRHVDESAMRASAERAYGKDLGWFFRQWVHGTGLLNYGMGADTTVCGGNGNGVARCVTRVRVTRYGELRHPMPVGVRTASGWHMTRAQAELDDQWVDVVSDAKPDSIALDPFHATWDWDWRDNTEEAWVGTIHAPDVVIDWPFLKQENRARTIVALAPRIWYSAPQGVMAGLGVRTSYLGLTDLHRGLIGAGVRSPGGTSYISQVQLRAQADDVYLAPFMQRPLMGVDGMVAYLDGIARGTLTRRWDLSPFALANGPKIAASATVSGTYPVESLLLPEQWTDAHVTEVSGRGRYAAPARSDSATFVVTLDGGLGFASGNNGARSGGYARGLASAESFSHLSPGQRTLTLRVNAGKAFRAPLHRRIFASSGDPFETFTNNYWRPRGAAFKQDDFTLVPVGGARLRGFSPAVSFENTASVNADLDQRLTTMSGGFGRLSIWGGVFGDAGFGNGAGTPSNIFVDVGAGIRVRGRLYDRDVDLRVSLPLAMNDPFANGSGFKAADRVRVSVDWR